MQWIRNLKSRPRCELRELALACLLMSLLLFAI